MSQVWQDETGGHTARRWRSPITWSVLLLIAWLLYELTTQPSLAIVTICLKFGWNDFQTASWLRRTDPNRPRARACFWLYLGSGFWKTALTALVPMFVVPALEDWQQGLAQGRQAAQQGPPPHFTSAFLTALGGFLLSAMTTGISVLSALRHRVLLWLHPAIHRDRRENIWPPVNVLSSQPNRIGRVLLAMVVVIVFPLFTLALILALIVAQPARGAAGQNQGGGPGALVFAVVVIGGLLGMALTILGAREWLLRRIAAATPNQCWTDALRSEAHDWTPST